MITYLDDVSELDAAQLAGFFVGWPVAPTAEQHLAVLRGSYRVVVARDDDRDGRVVGFVNAVSDGVLTAFVPWLEVLPEYQGRGIGAELVGRLLARLEHLYSVDLTCDPELRGYYEQLGLRPLQGMGTRNPQVLGGNSAL